MIEKYKIADVVFSAEFNYTYTKKLCSSYVYEGEEQPCFFIQVTKEDIEEESKRAGGFPPAYLESLALYRKFLNKLLDFGGTVFHSSALAVDGKAYLFTAPSGTGKSTHARLWRELLGDKVIMVNDDKPVIRLIDGKVFVYGTPWNGKHALDTNCKVEIKAICKLERAEQNSIIELEPQKMLSVILSQTLRPENANDYDKLLPLVSAILTNVNLYLLKCNKDISAAKLSYGVMSQGDKNEN
jgi:hypothetical protein